MKRALSDTTAFTMGFDDPDYDETDAATAAAERLGVKHVTQRVVPDATALLPTLVCACDEPFADSSMLPTYLLCQWARQHVTVALSGDGGDEAFAGYMRYLGVPLARAAHPLLSAAHRLLPGVCDRRLRAFSGRDSLSRRLWWLWTVTAGGGSLGSIYDRSMGHQDGIETAAFWSGDVRSALGGATQPYAELIDHRHGDHLIRMNAADYTLYLPDDVLMKVDRASMAHGLEVRSPLLDHRLVEAMAGLPRAVRMPGRRRKYLLRRLGEEAVGSEHLARPKRGFGVPLNGWFRDRLGRVAEDTLLQGEMVRQGYFDADAVRNALHLHGSGRANLGERLWTLLCLELWHRTYITPTTAPAGPVDWEEVSWHKPTTA
jgi:asparagine synthase (glutamine-hydrolysing)